MTTATIERIKQELTAARASGNGRRIAELYFSLPLSERNEVVTATGNRFGGGTVGLVPGRPARGVVISPTAGRPGGASWPSVSLSGYVLDELREYADFDRENGGWLVGPTEADASALEILRAQGRAHDEDRHCRSVALDLDQAREINRGLPAGHSVIGDWHCQPEGDGTPSQQDLKAWGASMELLHREQWLGLIVSERTASPGFFDVNLNAYIVRLDGDRVIHRQVDISTWRW